MNNLSVKDIKKLERILKHDDRFEILIKGEWTEGFETFTKWERVKSVVFHNDTTIHLSSNSLVKIININVDSEGFVGDDMTDLDSEEIKILKKPEIEVFDLLHFYRN